MKFEKLKTGNVSEIEKSIREDWGGVENILKKTIENRNGKDKYVFYDGPIMPMLNLAYTMSLLKL